MSDNIKTSDNQRMLKIKSIKVNPSGPTTKFVDYFGFTLEVPMWTKYVCFDVFEISIGVSNTPSIIAFEEKPELEEDNTWCGPGNSKFKFLDYDIEFEGDYKESLQQVTEVSPSPLQPIETAPKDKPILAYCNHEIDICYDETTKRLTIYAAHYDGMSHCETGWHIVEWGGEFDDSTWEQPGAHLPDWWFVAGTDFEVAANPTHWMELPTPPNYS